MPRPSALLIGTGEYTTGFVGGAASTSDKGSGVVALTFFDLRHRGKISSRVGLCGTSGTKLPAVRDHLKKRIEDVYGIKVDCETFPKDDVKSDPQSFQKAMDQFKPGDIVVVTTPDDTHFDITMAAIKRGFHVMVTKPLVKTLEEHRRIAEAAKKHNVIVCLEYHKRHDPIYFDAVNRVSEWGDMSYYTSFMSQPKKQLKTFEAWAGKSSDISYYLNSHHVDIFAWMMEGKARCIRVSALAADGVAKDILKRDCEDTITLLSEWKHFKTGNIGIATFTASWTAPDKNDVHSQQRFYYLGAKGDINVDQCRRGAFQATDDAGYASINPLYMRYTPAKSGSYRFVGQHGYGYRSFEVFVDAVTQFNEKKEGKTSDTRFDGLAFATSVSALTVTAILEAGRLSLDNKGQWFELTYPDQEATTPPASIRPFALKASL